MEPKPLVHQRTEWWDGNSKPFPRTTSGHFLGILLIKHRLREVKQAQQQRVPLRDIQELAIQPDISCYRHDSDYDWHWRIFSELYHVTEARFNARRDVQEMQNVRLNTLPSFLKTHYQKSIASFHCTGACTTKKIFSDMLSSTLISHIIKCVTCS